MEFVVTGSEDLEQLVDAYLKEVREAHVGVLNSCWLTRNSKC